MSQARWLVRCAGLMAFAAFMLPGRSGRCQTADPEVTALYESATKDLDARNYGAACPKLEEVTRRVPEGLGAMLTLGDCYRGADRAVAAWRAYRLVELAAMRTGNQRRLQDARERITSVQPRVGRISWQVNPTVAREAEFRVAVDNEVIALSELDLVQAFEPGEHLVVVSASGYSTWTKSVNLRPGTPPTAITIPALVLLAPQAPAPSPPPAASPAAVSTSTPPTTPVAPAVSPDLSDASIPTSAYVAFGAGAVGLAGAGVFGALSYRKAGDVVDGCKNGVCYAEDQADVERIELLDTMTWVALGLGLAGVSTGFAILVFDDEPPASAGAINLRVGANSVAVRGAF